MMQQKEKKTKGEEKIPPRSCTSLQGRSAWRHMALMSAAEQHHQHTQTCTFRQKPNKHT